MAGEAIFITNQYNSNHQREGRWRFYWYANIHQGREDLYSEGHYKNDQEIGLWKYYSKKRDLIRQVIHIQ